MLLWSMMRSVLVLGFICVSALGCSSLSSGTSVRYSQDAEVDFAPPLKLKIERAYWTESINRADDFAIPSRGSFKPDMSVKAQDGFLVIEVALTNYGSNPISPSKPPVFELKNPSGVSYETDSKFNASLKDFNMMGTNFGTNINPGKAAKGRLVFDVSRGEYELAVHEGDWQGSGFGKGRLSWIWKLSPTTDK